MMHQIKGTINIVPVENGFTVYESAEQGVMEKQYVFTDPASLGDWVAAHFNGDPEVEPPVGSVQVMNKFRWVDATNGNFTFGKIYELFSKHALDYKYMIANDGGRVKMNDDPAKVPGWACVYEEEE